MKPIEITDTNFEAEVTQSKEPVLIDFWATWCGPCRAIAPIVEELAGEYNGKLKVGKLDVDANQETAARFGILSIPTLMLFKGGKPVEQIVGAASKKTFIEKINKVLV